MAHGPSCSAACGILPDQGSNPCPLHWQADSQPLCHQGSPVFAFKKSAQSLPPPCHFPSWIANVAHDPVLHSPKTRLFVGFLKTYLLPLNLFLHPPYFFFSRIKPPAIWHPPIRKSGSMWHLWGWVCKMEFPESKVVWTHGSPPPTRDGDLPPEQPMSTIFQLKTTALRVGASGERKFELKGKVWEGCGKLTSLFRCPLNS